MGRLRGEEGAIAPLMAALLGGLVIASMWGANSASFHGVAREEQRAADLSALAGAANIPLTGLFASPEPVTTACDQAARLLTPAAAPMANNLAATRTGPRCSTGVTVEPLFDWSLLQYVQNALNGVIGPIKNLNLCGPLRALLDPFLGTLTGTDCQQLVTAMNNMPQDLAPGALTPQVRVTVSEMARAPVPLPAFSGDHLVKAIAKARRRFKNVVVVPAVKTNALGLPAPVPDLFSGIPAPLNNINLNIPLAQVRDQLIPELYTINSALGSVANPFMPAGTNFDLSGLILDVSDIYSPPTSATPPSPIELANEAILRGEPLIILRIFRMPVLGIPALDFTAAYLSPLAGGNFRATPVPLSDLSRANGLFGATLVQ